MARVVLMVPKVMHLLSHYQAVPAVLRERLQVGVYAVAICVLHFFHMMNVCCSSTITNMGCITVNMQIGSHLHQLGWTRAMIDLNWHSNNTCMVLVKSCWQRLMAWLPEYCWLTGSVDLEELLVTIGRRHQGYDSADPNGDCQMNSTSILENYEEMGIRVAMKKGKKELQKKAEGHRELIANAMSIDQGLQRILVIEGNGLLASELRLKKAYDRLVNAGSGGVPTLQLHKDALVTAFGEVVGKLYKNGKQLEGWLMTSCTIATG